MNLNARFEPQWRVQRCEKVNAESLTVFQRELEQVSCLSNSCSARIISASCLYTCPFSLSLSLSHPRPRFYLCAMLPAFEANAGAIGFLPQRTT